MPRAKRVVRWGHSVGRSWTECGAEERPAILCRLPDNTNRTRAPGDERPLRVQTGSVIRMVELDWTHPEQVESLQLQGFMGEQLTFTAAAPPIRVNALALDVANPSLVLLLKETTPEDITVTAVVEQLDPSQVVICGHPYPAVDPLRLSNCEVGAQGMVVARGVCEIELGPGFPRMPVTDIFVDTSGGTMLGAFVIDGDNQEWVEACGGHAPVSITDRNQRLAITLQPDRDGGEVVLRHVVAVMGDTGATASVAVPSAGPPAADRTTADCPRVSVIIPAYNRRHTLFATLASVFAQTIDDIEVIVVDDCSTDNTWGETLWFRKSFGDKLKYIRLSENQGESYARNVGLEHARGEHIAFLDSDDQWAPNYLERMLAVLASSSADVVWCFVDFCSVAVDGTREPEHYPWVNVAGNMRDGRGKIWLGPQHVLYRRSAAKPYDVDIDRAEDAELYERMLADGYRFHCLPDRLVTIIHHADSQNRSGSWAGGNKVEERRRTRSSTRAVVSSQRVAYASLVMPVWNRLELLQATLANLAQTIDASVTPCELIIIDNGSNDGTAQWLHDHYDDLTLAGHKVILNGWNAGIPVALNQGLLVAEGDLFVHAASDIHMEAGWLERLFDAFNSTPRLGVSGVGHDGLNGIGLTPETVDGVEFLTPPSDAAIGPALCFPADVQRRLGWFNEELGLYGREDTLLCRRARAAGYLVSYVAGTWAHHHGEHDAPTGESSEAARKRAALDVTLSYALAYSQQLAGAKPDGIFREIEDHFTINSSAVPLLDCDLKPSLASLCFTLRSDDLGMVEAALGSCLDGSADVPKDVVLVCNNAPPNVVTWALGRRAALMKAGILTHVINYRGNWGISKPYNAALGTSFAPFLVTVNDDIVAEDGWLAPMLRLAARPDTGYVCSNLEQHRASLRGESRPAAAMRGQGARPVEPRSFVGFASVLERRKLAAVGIYDENIHVYHAETDMAARLNAAGYVARECRDSKVVHLRARSTGGNESVLRGLADKLKPDSLR